VPSVATDVGDTALLLGKEGFLVRPRDSDALAQSILQIVNLNAEERAALGLRARQRVVDNFSLRHYVDRHLDLYERVIAGSRQHRVGGGP
jgi:glycosyltransferase involved in cell wall biosynthesis